MKPSDQVGVGTGRSTDDLLIAVRSLALVAAREKAEMMAAELGHTVAGTVLIREDRSNWWSSYGGWWGGGRGGYMSQNVVQ